MKVGDKGHFIWQDEKVPARIVGLNTDGTIVIVADGYEASNEIKSDNWFPEGKMMDRKTYMECLAHASRLYQGKGHDITPEHVIRAADDFYARLQEIEKMESPYERR